jgi:integrase
MSENPTGKSFQAISREYLVSLQERGLSNSSLVQASAGINLALQVIAEKDLGYKGWKPPRRKTRRVIAYVPSNSEVIGLLKRAETPLEHAIIATACYTGMRIGELSNLKISDLRRENMTILIRNGKGGKDRIIPFPSTLRAILVEYYRLYKPKEYLFCDAETKEPLTTHQIGALWTKSKARCPEIQFKGIHCLRHFFATRMITLGTNIITLQTLLGHAHATTTMRYLHMTTAMTQVAKQTMDIILAKA